MATFWRLRPTNIGDLSIGNHFLLYRGWLGRHRVLMAKAGLPFYYNFVPWHEISGLWSIRICDHA